MSIILNGGDVTNINKTLWDCGGVVDGVYIRVGKPTVESRAITGSSSEVDEKDITYTRTVGTITVTDYRWMWESAEPQTITRGTSNESVIIPDPSDDTLWQYVGNGTANITISGDRSGTYARQVTTSSSGGSTTYTLTGYADGSLRKHVTSAIDTALAGKDPINALKIYNSRNSSTGVFVRNSNLWTPCDLTCVPASGWGAALIASDIVLYANHAHSGVGTTIHFVAANGTVYARTITSGVAAPNYASYYPDWWIAKLDSPIPSAIKPAKFLPDNYLDYIPNHNMMVRIPSIGLNQFREATVQDVYTFETAVEKPMQPTVSPTDQQRLLFYKTKISGDSSSPLFIPVNNEPVLLTVWTYGGSGLGTSLTATAQKEAINDRIEYLGSESTITEVDLSGFNNYSS